MIQVSQKEQVLALLKKNAMVRPRDLEAQGIPRSVLYRLAADGVVEKIGRGLYSLAEYGPIPHFDFIEVAKRSPKSVICLLSALSFHEIGTQLPRKVWIMVANHSWWPKIEHPPLTVIQCDKKLMNIGVDLHNVDGVEIRVTSVARTVADCFKYRNRVGLDVALEALRESLRDKRVEIHELIKMAKACRVDKVMQPYLEALV